VTSSDDERLGYSLRAIRRRLGLTQRELAAAAQVPREDVMAIEAGLAGRLELDRLRRVYAAAGGSAKLSTWWRGAAADRLLDERHASIVERAVSVMRVDAWEPLVEASFSEYGERGSIDIFGAHRARQAVVVAEVKGSLGSIEETNRVLDAKERLAPKLSFERFGFRPRVVGRLLIVPEDRTIRRIVEAHAATMAAVYPARSREVRAWLRRPDGPLRGLWFLSEVASRDPDRG
jgi:transcriptional regulator with XRE-family HTH domain